MNEDFITYARKIKGHNFSAMVGVSAQQWRYENETFVGLNSSTDFIYTMNAFAANLDLSSTGSTLSNHSMASVFARVTYDYLGRYLFTANMRRRFFVLRKKTNGVISRQCQWDGVSQMKNS